MAWPCYPFNFLEVVILSHLIVTVMLDAKNFHLVLKGLADEFPNYFLGDVATDIFFVIGLLLFGNFFVLWFQLGGLVAHVAGILNSDEEIFLFALWFLVLESTKQTVLRSRPFEGEEHV